jgi:hypothetical protein
MEIDNRVAQEPPKKNGGGIAARITYGSISPYSIVILLISIDFYNNYSIISPM